MPREITRRGMGDHNFSRPQGETSQPAETFGARDPERKRGVPTATPTPSAARPAITISVRSPTRGSTGAGPVSHRPKTGPSASGVEQGADGAGPTMRAGIQTATAIAREQRESPTLAPGGRRAAPQAMAKVPTTMLVAIRSASTRVNSSEPRMLTAPD